MSKDERISSVLERLSNIEHHSGTDISAHCCCEIVKKVGKDSDISEIARNCRNSNEAYSKCLGQPHYITQDEPIIKTNVY